MAMIVFMVDPATKSPQPDQLVAQLVKDFSEGLYRQARSIVRDDSLAEDVVQETLVRAWLAYDTFRGEGSRRAWVMTIGHNVAVSMVRRQREDATEPSLVPSPPHTPSDQTLSDRLAVEAVWEALITVDDLSRTIIVLRDVEGLSYAEIATVTGTSLATIKTRLFRTRRLLANSLEDWR